MEVVKINGKISNDEKEALLVFDYALKEWTMDTTVMKFHNKAKKQGWVQLKEYVYDDGTVVGGVFVAPESAVSFRNPNKKRVMSEKQMSNLFGRGKEEDDE